jgi:hypothetical protein
MLMSKFIEVVDKNNDKYLINIDSIECISNLDKRPKNSFDCCKIDGTKRSEIGFISKNRMTLRTPYPELKEKLLNTKDEGADL